jgi:hypothetical protein
MAVVDAVREWLAAHNEKPSDGSMYAQMMEREKRRQAEAKRAEAEKARDAELHAQFAERRAEQQKRFDDESLAGRAKTHGTPVTAETFAAWLSKFEDEARAWAKAQLGASSSSAADHEGAACGAMGFVMLETDDGGVGGLTGRALFEEGSARILAAEAADVEAAAAALKAAEGASEDTSAVVHDPSLFIGDEEFEDDLDGLDDEDFDEDFDDDAPAAAEEDDDDE